MEPPDLREFLKVLEERGELKTVHGASWEEDIGGITELMIEQGGPALLFDEIPGHPQGYRVLANAFGTPARTAIGLGLDPAEENLPRRWQEKIRRFEPIGTEELRSGPVFENVQTGEAIDLFKFPSPKWHEQDGGRYIGTGVCVINQDPDTGFVNVGQYRVSVLDEKTCAIFIEHGKHGDLIRRKFWERGEKAPVVITVGQDPLLTLLAGSGVYIAPAEVSEFSIAGYLRGGPYPIVRGDVTGLPIPANAEIAIEGFIPMPSERLEPEGPFGEWTGYYAHGRRPETVIEVASVYHRNKPIIFGQPPSRPLGARYNRYLGADDINAMIRVEQAGIPGVERIFQIGRPEFHVVALRQMYASHVDDLVQLLVPRGDIYRGHQVWVFVDDDIDASSADAVIWAIASRCAPQRGVSVVPADAVWQLDPRIPPEDRSDPGEAGRKRYPAHNLVINACRPFDWFDEFPPVAVNSDEFRSRMRTKWASLFT